MFDFRTASNLSPNNNEQIPYFRLSLYETLSSNELPYRFIVHRKMQCHDENINVHQLHDAQPRTKKCSI